MIKCKQVKMAAFFYISYYGFIFSMLKRGTDATLSVFFFYQLFCFSSPALLLYFSCSFAITLVSKYLINQFRIPIGILLRICCHFTGRFFIVLNRFVSFLMITLSNLKRLRFSIIIVTMSSLHRRWSFCWSYIDQHYAERASVCAPSFGNLSSIYLLDCK